MLKAEGKIFPFEKTDKIKSHFLETIPYKGEKQLVQYTTKEFSAVCPFSGLPDIAAVIIEYIPNCFCVELKSLKYYFISFRNVGIYQEAVTNRIFHDLWRLLKPKYLAIKTVYNTRGGIDAVCVIEKGSKK